MAQIHWLISICHIWDSSLWPTGVKIFDVSDEQWVKTRQTRLTSTWRHYSAADIRASVPDRKKTKLFQTKCSNQRASYTWSWMLLSLKFLLPLDVSQSEAKKAASFACRIHSPSVPWCPWNENKMSARRFWLSYVLRDIYTAYFAKFSWIYLDVTRKKSFCSIHLLRSHLLRSVCSSAEFCR